MGYLKRFYNVKENPPHLSHALILFVMSAAAFILKLYLLNGRFLYIDFDEAYYLILARNLFNGSGFTFNGLPNIIFPPLLPMLIGFFNLVFQDLQYSLFVITALFGSLIGIVTYGISVKKLSSFYSLLCAAMALFVYQMNDFLPRFDTTYVNTLYRGSDILNCFLILVSIYFILCLVESDNLHFAALAGVFFALSYLTRPEGVLLFALILGCLILFKILSFISVSFSRICVFLLAFLFLSFPYMLYLKNMTGTWMLSGKTSSAGSHRIALLEVIRNDNWASFTEVHYAYDKDNMEMKQVYWGFHKKLAVGSGKSVKTILEIIPENLKMYGIIPKTLLSYYLLVFVLFGLGRAVFRIFKRQSIIDLILFIFFPYSLMIALLAYPIPRHHLFLVPLFGLYAVEGLMFVSSTLIKYKHAAKRIVSLLIFSIILFFMGFEYKTNLGLNHLLVPEFRKHRLIDLEVSRYLKQKAAHTVMSAHPVFAVRSHSDWQVLPAATIAEIIEFGKHKGVDYAVLPAPPESGKHYHIIDIRKSNIPDDSEDREGFTIIESEENFELIKFNKKTDTHQ